MSLNWYGVKQVFEDQPMWAAKHGSWGFIITQDEPQGYTASAKPIGSRPFIDRRNDLGGYCAHSTLDAAKQACESFLKAPQ